MTDKQIQRGSIVTGGAAGIGEAGALRLAKDGFSVAVCDMNVEKGLEVCEQINAAGGRAVFYETDVSDQESFETSIHKAAKEFGRIDCLFNNAGIGAIGNIEIMATETWHQTFRVNVDSIFYGCKTVLPYMREQGGGSIINNASISGLRGDYGLSTYNATKGAVINYTKALALDFGKDNVRVNAVCPGVISTPLTSLLVNTEAFNEETLSKTPLNRIGQPEDIAGLVSFLASKDSQFITGAIIPVDGGITAATGQTNIPALFS